MDRRAGACYNKKVGGLRWQTPVFLTAAVDVLMIPVGIKQPIAQLHGAAPPQVVRQLPQQLGWLQAFGVKFRQSSLSLPQSQHSTPRPATS